jgi:hypothetical protein
VCALRSTTLRTFYELGTRIVANGGMPL